MYAGQPNAGVLTTFADVLIKMFLRVAGESVRPGPCHSVPGIGRRMDFTVAQDFRGAFVGTCLLSLTSDVLMRISSRMLGEPVLEPGDLARDGASEFLNIVNGNVCAKLGGNGRATELTPPVLHDNRDGAPFAFSAAAKGGRLCVTPILHPTSGIEFALIDRTA